MVCHGSLKGLFSPCECPHHRLKHHPSFTVVGCYLAQPIEHGPYVRLFHHKDNQSITDYPNMKPGSATEAAHGCGCVLRRHGSLLSLFSRGSQTRVRFIRDPTKYGIIQAPSHYNVSDCFCT